MTVTHEHLVKPAYAHVTEYDVGDMPTIRRFLKSRASMCGLMGPFGSGKSVACVVKSVMLAHEMPHSADGKRRARIVVVRNTYPQLRDTTMRTVFEWLPPTRWGATSNGGHDYKVTEFEGVELEFMFRALDRPDHVNNLLSMEATHGWINEARDLPKEIIGPLFGRLGRYPRRADVGNFKRQLMMDTNPPDASEDSWWYQLYEVKRPPDAEIFKQPSGLSEHAENRRNLPSDYYEAMLNTMTEDEIRVYVHGEYGFLKKGRPVYPEYKDNFHCQQVEPKPIPLLRAWDFGLTPAVVFLQAWPDGRIVSLNEICSDRAGLKAFAQVVKAQTAIQYPWAKDWALTDVGDPSGEYGGADDTLSCFQILQAEGIDMRPGVQEPTLRQEAVRTLLRRTVDGGAGFVIDPKCSRLRKGFLGEYHYRRLAVGGGVEKYADKPEKNKYSHPHDALQYGAVELVGPDVLGLTTTRDEYGRLQESALSDFDPLTYDVPRQDPLEHFFNVRGSRWR